MRKMTTLLALLLCALLALPGALAEETYTPGALSAQLVTDAWNSGKLIRGDMKLRLDMTGEALGLDEEDQQILDSILPVLDSVTIGLGAGRTEGGLRVEADAALAHAQGGTPVTVSAAANVDLYGVSVESDLIAGRKVTARWETLLAMAGMNDSDISMLLMLRDMDWETMLPQIIAMAETYVQQGIQYALPYAEIIVNWAAALPVTLDAAPAPEGYPAAASSSCVTITAKDLANLAAALAEYLKTDTVVSGLCDLLIQEAYTGAGEAPTTAALCDSLIAEAAAYTNTENYIRLTWGADAAGMPVYCVADVVSAGEGSFSFGLSAAPNAAGNTDYALNIVALNADGTPSGSFTCSGEVGLNLFTASAQLSDSLTQIMGFDYSLNTAPVEGELPGQKLEHSMNMVVDDGTEHMQMIASGTASAILTADGGEVMDEITTMDMFMDDVQVTTTTLETFSIFPTEDGFTGNLGMAQSMPAMGLNSFAMDVMLTTKTYDPAVTAALAETALETSSSADMDELMNAVQSAAQLKLVAALQALPTEIVNLLIGQ